MDKELHPIVLYGCDHITMPVNAILADIFIVGDLIVLTISFRITSGALQQ